MTSTPDILPQVCPPQENRPCEIAPGTSWGSFQSLRYECSLAMMMSPEPTDDLATQILKEQFGLCEF
ncbi:MAG: hypothetical protein VYE53_02025, partial [Planctomycetota bacterium]|nr:hypothetical protein [Planctomycetota bacterium]